MWRERRRRSARWYSRTTPASDAFVVAKVKAGGRNHPGQDDAGRIRAEETLTARCLVRPAIHTIRSAPWAAHPAAPLRA